MPEAAIGSPERVAANVVTSENREAFINQRLDIAKPLAAVANPKPAEAPPKEEAKPAEGEKKAEAPAAAEDHAAELDAVIEEAQKPAPDEAKKQKFRERMSELATKRKEAEAKAQAESERAARLERELAEARKAAPPPAPAPQAGEPKPAPQRVAFSTEEEYQAALIDHRVEIKLAAERKAQAEAQAKAEQERAVRSYGERLVAVKAEIPDFDARIEAAKDLPIPPHIQDAMLESEQGPKIALYFADHRDEHARIVAMRPAAALRELGKIEAMLETGGKAAPAPAAAPKPAVEVSAAPAPISPVRGASGAIEAKVDSEGRFSGTYAEFKALRKAGKLK